MEHISSREDMRKALSSLCLCPRSGASELRVRKLKKIESSYPIIIGVPNIINLQAQGFLRIIYLKLMF